MPNSSRTKCLFYILKKQYLRKKYTLKRTLLYNTIHQYYYHFHQHHSNYSRSFEEEWMKAKEPNTHTRSHTKVHTIKSYAQIHSLKHTHTHTDTIAHTHIGMHSQYRESNRTRVFVSQRKRGKNTRYFLYLKCRTDSEYLLRKRIICRARSFRMDVCRRCIHT